MSLTFWLVFVLGILAVGCLSFSIFFLRRAQYLARHLSEHANTDAHGKWAANVGWSAFFQGNAVVLALGSIALLIVGIING